MSAVRAEAAQQVERSAERPLALGLGERRAQPTEPARDRTAKGAGPLINRDMRMS